MSHDWQVGDLAQCIKDIRPHRDGLCDGFKAGSVFRVRNVSFGKASCLRTGKTRGKPHLWLHFAERAIGVNSRYFVPIKRADDEFCEQMRCIKQKELCHDN